MSEVQASDEPQQRDVIERRIKKAQETYRLKTFSVKARSYWWRHQNQNSKDPRIQLYFFLEEPRTPAAKAFAAFMTLVITALLILMVVDSAEVEADANRQSSDELTWTFYAIDAVFGVELCLRYIAIAAPFDAKIRRRRRLGLLFWNVVDTLALTSFVIRTVRHSDLTDSSRRGPDVEWFEFFSSLRVGRALKALQRRPETGLIIQAIQQSGQALVICFCLLIAQIYFMGHLVYVSERAGRDASTASLPNLGSAVWFMCVTFTTVGYGECIRMAIGDSEGCRSCGWWVGLWVHGIRRCYLVRHAVQHPTASSRVTFSRRLLSGHDDGALLDGGGHGGGHGDDDNPYRRRREQLRAGVGGSNGERRHVPHPSDDARPGDAR